MEHKCKMESEADIMGFLAPELEVSKDYSSSTPVGSPVLNLGAPKPCRKLISRAQMGFSVRREAEGGCLNNDLLPGMRALSEIGTSETGGHSTLWTDRLAISSL